ncbi:hypothetical protein DFJ73DRAFT_961841 [Zopfochytrium polystomum]|nr:hypothetical protein DFJ73DRAFT_961841 [Zopfochytrium polystomum]
MPASLDPAAVLAAAMAAQSTLDDITATADITASSEQTDGDCAPNLCNPKEVVDNQDDGGATTTDATRWASKEEYTTGNTCTPQWLNFVFHSDENPVVLSQMTIQYGKFGFTFDGGNKVLPTVLVAYAPNGPYTTLTAGADYTATVTSVANQNVTQREDVFNFITTSSAVSGVAALNGGSNAKNGASLCQLDVEEAFVGAVNQTTLAAVQGSGASGGSKLSTGAIAGIAVAGVAVLAVLGLVVMRSRNVERRKKAALAQRV